MNLSMLEKNKEYKFYEIIEHIKEIYSKVGELEYIKIIIGVFILKKKILV